VLLGTSLAAAQTTRSGFSCGRVTAYNAPTANTAGSITLGTSRFDLAPGSAPDRPIAVGPDLCVNGQRNAAGAYSQFTVSPMAHGFCSPVTAYTPATATAAGSITFAPPSYRDPEGSITTLTVAPGVTFTSEQVTGGQCFTTGVNAQGNPEVVRYSGPWDGGATAPLASRQLPSTSVASTQAPVTLVLVALTAAGALIALARRRSWQRAPSDP